MLSWKSPLPAVCAVRVRAGAVSTPVCVTVPSECSVTEVSVVRAPTVRSASSRSSAVFSRFVELTVPSTLFWVLSWKSPLPAVCAVSVRLGTLITTDCVTVPSELNVAAVVALIPPTLKPPSSRKLTVFFEVTPANSVPTVLACVSSVKIAVPALPLLPSVSVDPLIAADCVTVPSEVNVAPPNELIPATSNPSSSRKSTVSRNALFASRVVIVLACVFSVKSAEPPPALLVSVRFGTEITSVCVTVPLELNVASVSALIPATLKPPSSRKLTVFNETLFASRVVIVLACVFSVKSAEPPPALLVSVSVVPLMAADCVTVPSELRVTAPAELIPATSKPVSSRNESAANWFVSASRVVTALFCVPSV